MLYTLCFCKTIFCSQQHKVLCLAYKTKSICSLFLQVKLFPALATGKTCECYKDAADVGNLNVNKTGMLFMRFHLLFLLLRTSEPTWWQLCLGGKDFNEVNLYSWKWKVGPSYIAVLCHIHQKLIIATVFGDLSGLVGLNFAWMPLGTIYYRMYSMIGNCAINPCLMLLSICEL